MRLAIAVIAVSLSACSTINNAGIGGAPILACSKSGKAQIDDRLIGSESVHLSVVRRFQDGDPLCVEVSLASRCSALACASSFQSGHQSKTSSMR